MSQPLSSLLSRISSLLKRSDDDSARSTPEQIARRIALPFVDLAIPSTSICWRNNLYFQHLYDLPRSALSGPIQEDKAEAHSFLANIVSKTIDTECIIDLRDIYGLSESVCGLQPLQSLESFATSDQCRHIRIISYRDFEKIITQAIPHFLSDQPISLRQANWLGGHLFWASEQYSCELACAVVYAKRRGLDLPKRSYISRYALNSDALRTLQKHYHVLLMPEQAWADRQFMAILVDSSIPYARLTLTKSPEQREVLLLPRHKKLSDNLGKGLKLAGAFDATETLLRLAEYR
ncbi:MAG: hypothetical protein KBD92_02100 [Thiopseudomonas sp.]|jgi:hypothetical protein|nr:hypothetical protein [Thiopseudomonas sp.]HHX06077.1 hypothetical protein [Pseudomonas sp.]MBP7996626.1 hypothetical protein [Thiopseudomonas sp.]MBP8007837.1 hypothetical protein [Thiopseudomonas sp.]MBP8770353.1 hypothetical protein [Thiopseudomonas sp.]